MSISEIRVQLDRRAIRKDRVIQLALHEKCPTNVAVRRGELRFQLDGLAERKEGVIELPCPHQDGAEFVPGFGIVRPERYRDRIVPNRFLVLGWCDACQPGAEYEVDAEILGIAVLSTAQDCKAKIAGAGVVGKTEPAAQQFQGVRGLL